MASITISIPDDQLTRIVNGICDAANYQFYLETTKDNPALTKAQFAKLQIIQFIKNTVRNQEIQALQQQATSTADAIAIT